MKYLGIDYGKRKVGLAISEGLLASPLKIIEIGSLSDAVAKISQVVKQEAIDAIVIGMPESGEARSITQKFVTTMPGDITIITVPETLSSANAQATMILLGIGKHRRAQEDAYAAADLLQAYLDTHQS